MSDATRSIFYIANASQDRTVQLGIPTETEWIEGGTESELREQVEAIKRCYRNDWIALDNRLRSP